MSCVFSSNPTHLLVIFLHDMLGSGSPEALHVRLALPPLGYVLFSNSSTIGLRMTTWDDDDDDYHHAYDDAYDDDDDADDVDVDDDDDYDDDDDQGDRGLYASGIVLHHASECAGVLLHQCLCC